jgi:hypothetical protein
MAVSSSDIKQYLSEGNPSDDVSASGGDISDPLVEFSDASVGEFIPTFAIDPSDSITWYYKFFSKNTNGSDIWYNVRFWIDNALLSVVAAGTVSLVSASVADDDNYRCKIVGEDSEGSETSEVVEMDGTTLVTSTKSFAKIHYVQFYDYTDEEAPVISTSAGNISITRGILLGKIPYGKSGALGNVEIGLDDDIDDDLASTDRLTAPADIDFYKANTLATARACTGASEQIPAGSAQGIWIKITFEGGVTGTSRIPLCVMQYGTSAE